jgi:magnesium transporter
VRESILAVVRESARRRLRHWLDWPILDNWSGQAGSSSLSGTDHDERPSAVEALALAPVIGDCAVYENGSRRPGRLPLEQAADVARHTNGFVWIGLQQPTEGDIAAVAEEFRLPALAVEDAVKAHQRPKLEVYDDVVFMVLKPVDYVDHDEVVDVSELAIFIGPRFVVSVRHGHNDALRRVRREFDRGDAELLRHGPSSVLYRAADLVVDGYEQAIALIDEDVDEIESQVFASANTADHSERIYKLKREIAEFRRAVQPLAAPLQRLVTGTVPGVDREIGPYFRDVYDHVLRASEAIEGRDRLLSDVLQADLAQVAARQSQIASEHSEIALRQNEIAVRQNEDMRKISAWAAIALVPTAIAGIYGMNFDNMPELRWKYGYFVVVAVIACACFGLHRLFRRNGWL